MLDREERYGIGKHDPMLYSESCERIKILNLVH